MMIRVWLIKDSQHIFGNHWLLFENSDINIELEVQSINDKNFQHFRIFFLDTRKSEQTNMFGIFITLTFCIS